MWELSRVLGKDRHADYSPEVLCNENGSGWLMASYVEQLLLY